MSEMSTARENRTMRDFSDRFKLSFRSLPEVAEAVANVVARFRTRGLRLGPKGADPEGRLLSREIVAGSLFLWFAGLEAREQDLILRKGMELLATELAKPSEGDIAADRDVARTLGEQNLDVEEDRREKAARGGKRADGSKNDSVRKDKGPDRDGSPAARR